MNAAIDRQERDGSTRTEALELEALRAGDDGAWAELIRRHGGRMLEVARRIVGDEDQAQDVLQDAWVAAFRSVSGFQGDAMISTWLHRITVNSALMVLRKKRRHPECSIDDLLPQYDSADGLQALRPNGEAAADAPEVLARSELRGLVRRAISRLPDAYRVIVVLRDIEEVDTAETARLLGITTGAVKVRLHRARQLLKSMIERDEEAASSTADGLLLDSLA